MPAREAPDFGTPLKAKVEFILDRNGIIGEKALQ
jgi:hypothetical protein